MKVKDKSKIVFEYKSSTLPCVIVRRVASEYSQPIIGYINRHIDDKDNTVYQCYGMNQKQLCLPIQTIEEAVPHFKAYAKLLAQKEKEEEAMQKENNPFTEKELKYYNKQSRGETEAMVQAVEGIRREEELKKMRKKKVQKSKGLHR